MLEIRKTRGGEVEERTHHAHGTRHVRTGAAGYGVFVNGRQVADIVGERSGFRGSTHWEIITTGYDDPRLNYRVLHRAPSLRAAKTWAIKHEQDFPPQKKTAAQLDAEIAEALTLPRAHATTKFWDKAYAKVADLSVGDVLLLGSVPPYTAHEIVRIESAPRRRVRLHLERLPDREHRSQSDFSPTATVGVPQESHATIRTTASAADALEWSEAAKRRSDDAYSAEEHRAAADVHRRAAKLHKTDPAGKNVAWLHELAESNHRNAAKARTAERKIDPTRALRTQKAFAAYQEKLAAVQDHTNMAQEYARQALAAARSRS